MDARVAILRQDRKDEAAYHLRSVSDTSIPGLIFHIKHQTRHEV